MYKIFSNLLQLFVFRNNKIDSLKDGSLFQILTVAFWFFIATFIHISNKKTLINKIVQQQKNLGL